MNGLLLRWLLKMIIQRLSMRYLKRVRIRKQKGCNITCLISSGEATSLILAAGNGNIDMVNALLKAGANIEAKKL